MCARVFRKDVGWGKSSSVVIRGVPDLGYTTVVLVRVWAAWGHVVPRAGPLSTSTLFAHGCTAFEKK
jgi:hypothetical protein